MKSKLILLVIVVVVIIGLLAYYQYVPFWVSIVSTGAFIFGVFLGWLPSVFPIQPASVL